MITTAAATPNVTATTAPSAPQHEHPTVPEQAGMLLGHAAGYMAVRIIDMGQRAGLIAGLADRPGATHLDLAESLGLDEFYVSVWCRGALGAGILQRQEDGFALAPHVATLLLDQESPAYAGALFPLIRRPEMFGRFDEFLPTGQRMWWSDTSPEWIASVAGTGRPFYTRLVPGGLEQVPGLAERLADGCLAVDHACGSGVGLTRLARTYPHSRFVGVDGDALSIDRARAAVTEAGVADRVELVCSPLEEFTLVEPAAVVINNISMHECRDIDVTTERVLAALEQGGVFVISDFPFPDTDDGLRTVPGRIMSGIQFFEAQIDDQLLPRSAYDDLLARHGFTDLGTTSLTPVHSLTWGHRP